ncbi:hypothetical protein [Parafrankia sp. FMc2]|uniref:hypothetical protein n=1 Tax=Parafrankia sp. FMc2 TaxID=3233196 RepID=UPI0034D574C5
MPLIVLYRQAAGLNREIDPRANALGIDTRWLVRSGAAFGFGRAPSEVDIAVPLMTPTGAPEPSMPRLAGRISQLRGRWAVENRSTTGTKLLLTAPGLYREITRHSPPELLPRPRQWLTLRSADADVEHRFHLIVQGPTAPGFPPAPHPIPPPDAVAPAPPDARAEATTTAAAPPPAWSPGDARTLAAFCYPELCGLPPRPRDRTRQTLSLLNRAHDQANEKWLERQLARLRRDAAERLGTDLRGEHRTPLFVDHVVQHHALLGPALRSLDEEFLATHRPVKRSR